MSDMKLVNFFLFKTNLSICVVVYSFNWFQCKVFQFSIEVKNDIEEINGNTYYNFEVARTKMELEMSERRKVENKLEQFVILSALKISHSVDSLGFCRAMNYLL